MRFFSNLVLLTVTVLFTPGNSACNDDFVCDVGEDCNTCPNDCRGAPKRINNPYCCEGGICSSTKCNLNGWFCLEDSPVVIPPPDTGVGPDGDPAQLLNDISPELLNTGNGAEAPAQIVERMSGGVPPVNPEEFDPNYGPFDKVWGPYQDPVINAKCLNEPYTIPTGIDQKKLYQDYVKIFDWGFLNEMGPPLQSKSIFNNRITNNRFPGMFLRMCFHDNSVNPDHGSFNEYVKTKMNTEGQWTGPLRYLDTSGADASVLLCPEERYHPNQNYDQTASRILYALQDINVGITDDQSGAQTNMIEKYKLSYSDLLHNGGVAAAIYLNKDPSDSWFTVDRFTFGRRDACFLPPGGLVDGVRVEFGEVYRLCGPSQLLPGVSLESDGIRSWFDARGMNELTWLALMWTHTTMDNMAFTCPMFKLPAETTAEHLVELDRYKSTGRIYFNATDVLDYFDFFLYNGASHHPAPIVPTTDFEAGNCNWKINGRRYHWPMVRTDCALSVNAVNDRAQAIAAPQDLDGLKTALASYIGVTTHEKNEALLFALGMLGGNGIVTQDGPLFASFPPIGTAHLFGAYYGDTA